VDAASGASRAHASPPGGLVTSKLSTGEEEAHAEWALDARRVPKTTRKRPDQAISGGGSGAPKPPARPLTEPKKPRPFTEIPYALQAGGRRFDPGWLHVLPLRPQTRA
jgi:hypothetical protein